MKSMRTPLLLLGPLMMVAAGSAMAGPVVEVKVPFAFAVRDHVLPAGDYRVTRADEDPGVLIIQGEHGVHATVLTRSIAATGKDPAGDRSALVFTREGDGYRLKDVWQDRDDGQEIPSR
jgi:hypothetical protein